MKSNAASVKKIIRKKYTRPPRHGGKRRTYPMLLPVLTTPKNSHTSWNIEGTDVLDTEILYGTKRCFGTPMAFSLSSKPRSSCRMGSLQDFGIHGLGSNFKKISESTIAYAIDFDDTDIDTFIARRPDCLAFDK